MNFIQPIKLVSLLVLWISIAIGQFSPGPLSKPHDHLIGNQNCEQCHTKGKSTDFADCLKCHTPIRTRIDAGKGFHGKLENSNCINCHSDHNGLEFQMIHWPDGKDNFKHDETGFVLQGKHIPLKCESCHSDTLIIAEDVKHWEISVRQPHYLQRTYLGLGTTCKDCHKNIHGKKLDKNCTKCHDQEDWKTASKTYDHNLAEFKLRESHLTVACNACHFQNEKGKDLDLSFSLAKGGVCTDCHEDVHKGHLKGLCTDCHNEHKWQDANLKFDHSKSRFPLERSHAKVSCRNCHFTVVKGVDPDLTFSLAKGEKCINCHADVHKGSYGAVCESCHTTGRWQEVLGFDHSKTKFPHRGKHVQVKCEKCHTPGVTPVQFDLCGRCHEDKHQGQFSSGKGWMDCARCHDESNWRPSLYTVSMHQQSRFQLSGGHLAIPCFLCHEPVPEGTTRFVYDDPKCSTCHQDAHSGQFTSKYPLTDCNRCHTVQSWAISSFDHSRAEFPLDGKHVNVACDKCHFTKTEPVPESEGIVSYIIYRPLPHDCADCHKFEDFNK